MSTNQLQPVEYACHRLNEKPQRVYNLIRECRFPVGVVVRIGRHIRINPEKLEDFIASGGHGFPGGWRKESSGGQVP